MDIDFVVLWVDGDDPVWQAEKAKYQGKTENDSNAPNRFRDWGLMPYWFRAVERFAPWVRKIHFVTCGHVPEFLNMEHPKLCHVKHTDFLPAEVLPTFSSHAIEMNLHRIPGLAEHFVYFNDDMFLIRPVQETVFFKDGLPCTDGGEIPIKLSGEIGVWQHAAVNDLGVINAHFNKREQVKKYGGKYRNHANRWQDNVRTLASERLFPDYFTGFKNLHAPAAYTKGTFEEVWRAEPELLARTTANRFRSAEDVNQWVCLWWQIAGGQFAPSAVSCVSEWIIEEEMEHLADVFEHQKADMVCLNDPDGDIDFTALAEKMTGMFQRLLPEKSSFEK